ncbi:hypothetical protein O181_012395 [Austropuccinia psidii MF-1]|uniref:Uncharacterized protein n=1 Tax=Austropuccinia psidii MF-1 TaxID=1389203 RepID=A0A9Q3BXX2_9BASI|nr:hypothetical protein [Austropuccinia psidii MF-1]
MSPQAVSYQFHHKKNNFPIPPPPKVLIPQLSPSIAPPTSKATSGGSSSEQSYESPIPKSILEVSQGIFLHQNGLSSLQQQEEILTANSNTPAIIITVIKVLLQAPPSSNPRQVPPALPSTSGTVESEPQQTAEELLLELAHPREDPLRSDLLQFYFDMIIKLTL